MSRAKNRTHLGKNLVALVFASILLASLGMSAKEVFAMGQAPSTCNNRYDGTITHMKIIAGDRIFYPIANPGLTFRLQNDKSYTVTFTIHTPAPSSQNNSLNGSTWYDTSAPGYQFGTCVNGVGPNQDVTVTLSESHSNNLASATTQTVTWNTLVAGEITYNVKWVNPG